MRFKQILPSDYPKFKVFFARQRYKLCAYSLSSIIVWSNHLYNPYGAIDGETLIICNKWTTRKKDPYLILPISQVKEYVPEELHDLAVTLGIEAYWFVPDDYIKRYKQSRIEHYFEVIEQKEFEDYVYLTEDLSELKGNKYSKKRNLIHQFERDYLRKGRVRIEKITPSVVSECNAFIEEWCKERGSGLGRDKGLAREKQAAINAVENINILEASGILVRIDGVFSAFGISSKLTNNMGALHFEKAFAGIKGLYQFVDNKCAKHLFNGCTYINKESDMNIRGLARAKKSYHPIMRIKSYRLRVR